MKKQTALILLLFFMVCQFSCREQEEIIDPIIGTWRMETDLELYMNGNYHIIDEWIFEPTDSGRYRTSSNGFVLIQDTFQWSSAGEIYTLNYSTEKMHDEIIEIGIFQEQVVLWGDSMTTVLAYKIE